MPERGPQRRGRHHRHFHSGALKLLADFADIRPQLVQREDKVKALDVQLASVTSDLAQEKETVRRPRCVLALTSQLAEVQSSLDLRNDQLGSAQDESRALTSTLADVRQSMQRQSTVAEDTVRPSQTIHPLT